MSPAQSGPPTRTPWRPWPARSRAAVAFFPTEQRQTRRTARRLFGRLLKNWEYAGLAGAPDDALVQLGACGEQLYIEISDPLAAAYRGYHCLRREGAELVLRNDGLRIQPKNMRRKGLGLRIFHRQLENARLLGLRRIETTAGRSGDENGYYTWPRFGFNGPLPPEVKQELPLGLEKAQTVLDLMESEKGRLWWKEHGVAIGVTFEVAEGSRSQTAFARYVCTKLKLPRERGAKTVFGDGQKEVLKIAPHLL